MSIERTAKRWIQLRHDDTETEGVTVTPADGDAFSLTKEMAMQLSSFVANMHEFRCQVEGVLEALRAWGSQHADEISEAYLTIKGTGFLFLVIQKSPRYNRKLVEVLTDLDIRIAQNPEFNLVHLSVLAIPPSPEETVKAFLSGHSPMVAEHA